MKPQREIIQGTPGDTWTNTGHRVAYQFFVRGNNTCGICWQYERQIAFGPWPLPIHHNCRCRQERIAPNASARSPFVDFEKEIAALPSDQQQKIMGVSNWKLYTSGVVKFGDVVTPYRIRDLREVVDNKHLGVKQMIAAGVKPVFARRAYDQVHTAAHEAAAQTQSAAVTALTNAGISHDALFKELGGRLANRVNVELGPAVPGTKDFAWGPSRINVPSHTADLLNLLKPRKPRKPKPEKPKPEKPEVVPIRPTVPVRGVGNVTEQDLEEVRAIVNALPVPIRKYLSDHGIEVVFGDKLISYDPILAAESPRGWPAGMTLEHTDGIYVSDQKAVLALKTRKSYYSEYYQPSGRTEGVLRHELGHAIDMAQAHFHLTEQADFLDAYDADVGQLDDASQKRLSYQLQAGAAGRQETFAEVFAGLHGGGVGGPSIVKDFPRVSALIQDWIAKLP